MIAVAIGLIALALLCGAVCINTAGNARTSEQINATVGLGLTTLIAFVAGCAPIVRWLFL